MLKMAHYLYRQFNNKGELLYVGITWSVQIRHQAHKFAEWWDDITTITIERFETKQEASEAEISAICKENPKFNIYHKKL